MKEFLLAHAATMHWCQKCESSSKNIFQL